MSQLLTCQLANRGVIAVGGPERRAFLQGLISNDMDIVTHERAIYAALLTPQGKFLHDLFIIEAGEELLVDCEVARTEDLLKRLAAYKLRAKITLRSAPEFEVLVSEGKDSGIRIQDSGLGDRISFIDPRLPELGIRAFVKNGNSLTLNPQPQTSYDRLRLSLGIPDGSRDMIIEKSVLTDGNFDLLNGISFTKGCYVGQEITARMHYRALVKKRMFPVKIEGTVPAFGAIIKLGDEEIGDMRSSSGDIGLALLNLEKAEGAMRDGMALICGESRLGPYRPKWMKFEKP